MSLLLIWEVTYLAAPKLFTNYNPKPIYIYTSTGYFFGWQQFKLIFFLFYFISINLWIWIIYQFLMNLEKLACICYPKWVGLVTSLLHSSNLFTHFILQWVARLVKILLLKRSLRIFTRFPWWLCYQWINIWYLPIANWLSHGGTNRDVLFWYTLGS